MFWVLLWKAVFLITVSVYAVMAVWVTFRGALDIRDMLIDLKMRERPENTPGEEA